MIDRDESLLHELNILAKPQLTEELTEMLWLFNMGEYDDGLFSGR